MKALVLIYLSCFLSVARAAQVPPLKLDLVLSYAIKSNEQRKLILTDGQEAEALTLRAKAPLDPRLTVGSTAKYSTKTDSLTPLVVPERTQGNQYSLGIQKAFSTGTTLNLEVSQNRVNNTYTVLPTQKYYETEGSLSVRQSLWQNALGVSTRANLKASEHDKKAVQAQVLGRQDEWALGIIRAYYLAWLSQINSKLGEESLLRRERLVGITQTKVQRGTSEQPDLLQIEASRVFSENTLRATKRDLLERWRQLIIALGLPDEYLALDPMKITIVLGDEEKEAAGVCADADSWQANPKLLAAKEQQAGAILKAKAAGWNLAPDVSLVGALGTQSLNDSRKKGWDEARDRKYPNWSMGASLVMPLDFSAERASVLSAKLQEQRSQLQLSSVGQDLRLEWVNGCQQLKDWADEQKSLEILVERQQRRARLETDRFRLGRSSTVMVIQAEDDVTQAQSALSAAQVNRRLISWQLLALAGQLTQKLPMLKEGL